MDLIYNIFVKKLCKFPLTIYYYIHSFSRDSKLVPNLKVKLELIQPLQYWIKSLANLENLLCLYNLETIIKRYFKIRLAIYK